MDLMALQDDPVAFRSALLIDCADSGPRAFNAAIDPRQASDFASMDAGWQAAIGQSVPLVDRPIFKRGWIERGRGGSKSSDAMVAACWALFAAKRPVSGVVCACDRDQASICRN